MAGLMDFLAPAAGVAAGVGTGVATGNPLLGVSAGMGIYGALSQYGAGEELQDALSKASGQERAAIESAIKKLNDGWQHPELDTTPITPEELRVLEQYAPKVAQFTQENAPQLVRGLGQQEAISAQRDALQRLQAMSVGEDPISRAQQESAVTKAQQSLAGERANILQELAARGAGGGGTEVLAQMAAAGNAERMARQESLDAAAQNAMRRQQALTQMAGLAGTMRGQAAQQEQTNVDILNSFNQRAAMRKQAYDQYKAAQENEAKLRNMSEAQRLYEASERAKYDAAIRNQALKNQAETARASSQNELLSRTTGMETGLGQSQAAATRQIGQVQSGQTAALGEGAMRAGTTLAASQLGQPKKPTEPGLPETDDYVPEAETKTGWVGKSSGYKQPK
jgi:hypothetical protein